MIIIKDMSLQDFEFWGGATATAEMLTDEDLQIIEEVIEELYPQGLTETDVNDIFWFDDDFIAETLGYDDYETLWDERHPEETQS